MDSAIFDICGHEIEITVMAGANGWVWKATATDPDVAFTVRSDRGFGSEVAAGANAINVLRAMLGMEAVA